MRIFCLISLICACLSPLRAAYSEIERSERLHSIVTSDLAKLTPNDVQWIFSQAIKSKDFNKKIARIKVSKLSHKLKDLSQKFEKPAPIGNSNEYRSLNRFGAPYDETRTLRNIPNFYISASDVLTPRQAYIVGEEPLASTINNFWQSIIRTHTQTIVALCMPYNRGYYDRNNYPKVIDGWTVSHISEETIASSPFIQDQKIVKRVFWATKETQKQVINHIHVENWPDHGAIEGTLFHQLLDYIDQINPDGSSPIFVHCAAGRGRSGTFVAAHSIYKELSSSKTPKEVLINLPLRILQLRMQRRHMLSTNVQFNAVINAVREKVRQ